MSCNYPVGTYRSDRSPTYRPCGMCIGCRLEYARQWAVRCIHEASMHDENCFVTLTYNDKNLPKDKSVDKRAMQLFLKRLRKKIEPKKVRFFGCGEYGDQLGRPHYHLCLFGHKPTDLTLLKSAQYKAWKGIWKKGNTNDLYTAESIENVWRQGFVTVGEVTFESAGYVARYVTKKMTGPLEKNHYKGKTPEFALMSRRPGIGLDWIKRYTTDVYPKDYHHVNGKRCRPNRYYDAILQKINPKMYEEVKKKRIKNADECTYESHLRKFQKEKHTKLVTKRLERSLENEKN